MENSKQSCSLSFLTALSLSFAVSSAVSWSGEARADNIEIEQNASFGDYGNVSAEIFKDVWAEEQIFEFSKLPTSGVAARIPVSGHWYPEYSGGLNATNVLTKYDQAFNGGQNIATAWESANRVSGISWAGHCNGFAAAAIRHREPKRDVVKNGVTFTRRDIKALLASLYMGARFKFLAGNRCERNLRVTVPTGSLNECEDVNPGLFHVVIANWIGRKKQAIIFDRNGDSQVWNYPLFEYSSVATPVDAARAMDIIGGGSSGYLPNANATSFLDVKTNVSYSDAVNNQEVLEYLQTGRMSYRYILELDDAGKIIGGEWAISSRTEHPDFLWIPLAPMKGSGDKNGANPGLEPAQVIQLWAESRGLLSPLDEPPPFDIFTWDSNWGNFGWYRLEIDSSIRGATYSNFSTKLKFLTDEDLQLTPDDRVEILLDGKLLTTSNIDLENNMEIILPPDAGLGVIDVVWKTSTYSNPQEPHRVQYFLMD